MVEKDDDESAWQSAASVVEKDDQEESYDAYLARERKESAQHYLKPYRKKFWVCWGLLAAAGLLILNGNFGLALLYGLPPMIYMWSIYSVAYFPDKWECRAAKVSEWCLLEYLSLFVSYQSCSHFCPIRTPRCNYQVRPYPRHLNP